MRNKREEMNETSIKLNVYEKCKSDFIRKYFQEKIVTPNRYIWHVSPIRNRESIAENGIHKSNMDGAVFANNFHPQNRNIVLMWPFPIDSYDHPSMSDLEFYSLYDFWRIDTFAYSAEWRIDPNLKSDLDAYNLRSVNDYVCSLSNVPKKALRLYKYQNSNYSIYRMDPNVISIIHTEVLKVA